MYFLLMYIMLIFSSCGDDGNEDWENGDKNTSQTEFKTLSTGLVDRYMEKW